MFANMCSIWNFPLNVDDHVGFLSVSSERRVTCSSLLFIQNCPMIQHHPPLPLERLFLYSNTTVSYFILNILQENYNCDDHTSFNVLELTTRKQISHLVVMTGFSSFLMSNKLSSLLCVFSQRSRAVSPSGQTINCLNSNVFYSCQNISEDRFDVAIDIYVLR